MILPEPRDRFRGTLPKRWVALDFETTGIWKKDSDVAVIEIGLITYERDREVAAWSALVKSDSPVSDFIAELTGITQAMIDKDGVDVDEAGDALAERLAGAELVIAHNMSFDAEGLQWLGIELGRDQHTYCTMRGLTAPDQKWPRLEEVVKEFQIKLEGPAHRAESDARTAGRVFIEMVRRGYRPHERRSRTKDRRNLCQALDTLGINSRVADPVTAPPDGSAQRKEPYEPTL